MKTLNELKKEYEKLENIKSYEDLKSLACNFIRMITWKKIKDLDYISNAYIEVLPFVIKDILKNGFNEALKKIKKNDLHKAYNINYIYDYYGLDYQASKKALKTQKISIIE